MAAKSAGILMYRKAGDAIEVMLVHPGGPYWRRKDLGAWSIPKGEYGDGETPDAVALREFEEELGTRPVGLLRPLGSIVQAGGKSVTAFAVEGDLDTDAITSNDFTMEWPPKSGQMQSFPEIDRAEWFRLSVAHEKLLAGQRPLLERLVAMIRAGGDSQPEVG